MIGTSIGNFRIQRLIGEGGMGKVYLAVHPKIGRQAAVKVLPASDAADPQIVSRFITEARAANEIRHPNIVDIYDSGVLEGGAPYIVMEYLEGESLAQTLARGPLDIVDAIDWSCQIAEALAAAHAREVVHRDLKPDNLFLIPDVRRLGKKQVKVLDFGIAKLQRRNLDQVHKTRTGSLLGTPLYMSPEQCMSMKDVDARTDIYSLGVILYEMVTGRRPFDSEAVFALISMQINDKPEPPSTHRSDLPPDLEAIILQALAKHPAQRQESMAVVLSQLELARGNPQASSDALLRARHEQRKVLPFPIRPMPQVQAEISTLRDTAISRGATGRTGHGKGPARWGLYVAGAVAAAALAMYLLAPHGSKAELPQAAAIVSPSAVPSQPAVPLPPPPVEIALNSIPSGAMVYAGELLIGTTPTTYRTEASDKSVEFTFRAEGYAAETIHALPAQGLKITTNLTALAPPKRAIHPTRRMAPGRSARASSEIQIER